MFQLWGAVHSPHFVFSFEIHLGNFALLGPNMFFQILEPIVCLQDCSMESGARKYQDMVTKWSHKLCTGVILGAIYTIRRAGPVGTTPGSKFGRNATEREPPQRPPGLQTPPLSPPK